MLRVLYSGLLTCLIPVALFKLFIRGFKSPAYWSRWRERFGILPCNSDVATIWVHAVSVGEFQAAIPLIKQLKIMFPHHSIMVTTATPTGSSRVLSVFGDSVLHSYIPYDLGFSVVWFLKKVRPEVAIIMETEIWPNLYFHCFQLNIPVLIVNARLSEKSAKGYLKFSTLTKQTLWYVKRFLVQSEADGSRFLKLGAPKEKIHISGNIKFDAGLPDDIETQSRNLRRDWGQERQVWIVSSTHDGEESQVLSVFKKVKEKYPELLLVLVPRHPERFIEVKKLCINKGLEVICRSERIACSAQIDIFLGDTLGELMLFYAASDIALVGGSLVPVGGHNVLEPAALSMPVIYGKFMFNFAEISEMMLQEKAAIQVENINELETGLVNLLCDPLLAQRYGEKALAIVERNRGALKRTTDAIRQIVG